MRSEVQNQKQRRVLMLFVNRLCKTIEVIYMQLSCIFRRVSSNQKRHIEPLNFYYIELLLFCLPNQFIQFGFRFQYSIETTERFCFVKWSMFFVQLFRAHIYSL
ncbi:hypothetical protein IscW_ISCW001661 [Ixodes scapularis]|uniref:Uncharacterized protein n=1 Tax=Ixodes scapularis TaxID=6945 RepID=B7P4R2_IXOSC|nr:hypothetical protein IscW_ISCW001661 [Ixodes scapularis]|eukprot:XP_002406357.1 hypothetical protein IscW_ISCW001661 [Ixodes scapularis]